MLTLEDYFGRHSSYEKPSDEVMDNAADLLAKVNGLLMAIGSVEPTLDAAVNPVVRSGWRPKNYNMGVPNAAPNSKHITGQAIDLADDDGELDGFLLDHPEYLVAHDVYIEHPLATKSWTHIQSVGPRSGNRVFFP